MNAASLASSAGMEASETFGKGRAAGIRLWGLAIEDHSPTLLPAYTFLAFLILHDVASTPAPAAPGRSFCCHCAFLTMVGCTL